MRTIRVALAASTALWLAASTARGQSGPRHDGLSLSAALGHGTMNASCDSICSSVPRTGGTTGLLQVEGTVSRHVRVGGALHIWWHSGSPDFTSSASAAERLSNLGAVLHYYPAATGGLFFGGGLGLSNYHSKSADAYSNAWGWGFTADAGYDIALASVVSLTPRLTYSFGGIRTVKNVGAHPFFLTGWRQTVINLGVGLTLR